MINQRKNAMISFINENNDIYVKQEKIHQRVDLTHQLATFGYKR